MNATTTIRPRVLLLDDDSTTLRVLGTALLKCGFDVRAARDGEAGVETLLDELLDLDVLVVDSDLPLRDGASFVRLVREAGGERDLAIVLLADRAAPEVARRLLALGADAVVERSAGVGAAVDAVVAAAPRREERARRPLMSAGCLVRPGVLALAVASPPVRLDPRAA
jgi:DNA-binding response OmpR family regulator